jgi:hypothetical protein
MTAFPGAVIIPGARVCTKTRSRAEEAYLAMQAAIDVGQYFLAERIRRQGLLRACSICSTLKPPKGPPRVPRWRTVPNGLQTDPTNDDLLLRPSLLVCWECHMSISMDDHYINGWPNEPKHSCLCIDPRHKGLPRLWACEATL